MGFRCGIVGAPNVGKSTLFNALTNSEVAAENYPFCTVDANVGLASVVDDRLPAIAPIVGVETLIPTVLEFVDIAGLVAGASRGDGLGNRFLAHIREMDLLAHVAGGFNTDTNAVNNNVAAVELELILADLETVERAQSRVAKLARVGDKDSVRLLDTLKRVQLSLESETFVNALELDKWDADKVAALHLLTAKPMFYVLNVDEDAWLSNSFDWFRVRGSAPVIVVCAKLESELARLDDDTRDMFYEELDIKVDALQNIVHTGCSLLGLGTFFTYNDEEVRAWTFAQNTTAQQAAGKIHTDMEQGFIRAEVMSIDDLTRYGSEQAVRDAGRVRYEGKTYLVNDGDILRIRFRN